MKHYFLKLLVVVCALMSLSHGVMAQSEFESESFQKLENKFHEITKHYDYQIKVGSRPFLLSQHAKAPTVIMLHGLSDSPGSMVETSKIYFKMGYNVVSILLRDHGLLEQYRHKIRSMVTLEQWREDIDQLMVLALQMSNSRKVALIGYSLGGALAIDTANRFENRVSSIVLMAPMLKIQHSKLASMANFLKYILYSTKKGIAETPHFYPDIALNQSYQAYRLTRYLEKVVMGNPNSLLLEIPKLMFLTDADLTVENVFAIKAMKRIHILENDVVIYPSNIKNNIILHRDLPMRLINASNSENPIIDDLLDKLEVFLKSIDEIV
jgi:alpha-beta hydrolase superfamily lysophospholipase